MRRSLPRRSLRPRRALAFCLAAGLGAHLLTACDDGAQAGPVAPPPLPRDAAGLATIGAGSMARSRPSRLRCRFDGSAGSHAGAGSATDAIGLASGQALSGCGSGASPAAAGASAACPFSNP